MINAPIELEIYVFNEETLKKEELGIYFDYTECELRTTTFYFINAIYPCIENGVVHGSYVCTNGNQIVTPMKYEELKSLINKRI